MIEELKLALTTDARSATSCDRPVGDVDFTRGRRRTSWRRCIRSWSGPPTGRWPS